MTIYQHRVSCDLVNHQESQQNNPRAMFDWCRSEVFSLTVITKLPARIVLIIKLQHVTRIHITMAQLHECHLELELSWQWPMCILATFRFVYIKYADLIATSEIFCNILFTLMSAFCLHVFSSLMFSDKKPNDDTLTYNFLTLTFKLQSSSRLQHLSIL